MAMVLLYRTVLNGYGDERYITYPVSVFKALKGKTLRIP